MSYDDTDALADFVHASGVEFTMLSDVDSAVIQRYDVLNTIVQPDDVPFFGIPFPGFFLVDEDGVIVDKLFHRHLANREGIETILDSFNGCVEHGDREPMAAFVEDDGIQITAFLRGGGGVLRMGPMRRLVVRFEMPDGLHIYDEPVPAGMVATSIEVSGPEGVRFESVERPPTHLLELPGLADPLHVWNGTTDFVIPLFANSAIVPTLRSGAESITLQVTVRFQACDDEQCFLPQTRTVDLDVPIDLSVMPGFEFMQDRGANIIAMNSDVHLQRLVERKRSERSPEG